MLTKEPKKRITVANVTRHPFFASTSFSPVYTPHGAGAVEPHLSELLLRVPPIVSRWRPLEGSRHGWDAVDWQQVFLRPISPPSLALDEIPCLAEYRHIFALRRWLKVLRHGTLEEWLVKEIDETASMKGARVVLDFDGPIRYE
jgi:hypothetical protein